MGFRDDGDALRNRVDALEDELARAKDEAERLREERDRALAAAPEPAPHPSHFRAGDSVWVEWRHRWWRATVLHVVASDRFRIHYVGWSSSWDEEVGLERIAPGDRPPPGARAATPRPGLWLVLTAVMILAGVVIVSVTPHAGAPPAGTQSPGSIAELVANEPVWIDWNGTWWAGHVVSIDPSTSRVRVHYEGYEDSYDEDATLDRIRVGAP